MGAGYGESLLYYRSCFEATGTDAAMWGSPNAFWCYAGESFVGSIKGVAAASKQPSIFVRQDC